MNRNVLYIVVAALVVVVLVLGYMVYQDRQQPDGIRIELGEDGVSVEAD